MTDNTELETLSQKIERFYPRAKVEFLWDEREYHATGHHVIMSVRVLGVPKVGPAWMAPISAAERMRTAIAEAA